MLLNQARECVTTYSLHEPQAGRRSLMLRRKAVVIAEMNPPSPAVSPDQPAARLIICDHCGESFKTGLEKGRHVKKCRRVSLPTR